MLLAEKEQVNSLCPVGLPLLLRDLSLVQASLFHGDSDRCTQGLQLCHPGECPAFPHCPVYLPGCSWIWPADPY